MNVQDLSRGCGAFPVQLCHAECIGCQQCGERGTCCCSQCEDTFGAPRQAAQSQSQAGESTLVLRPGYDQYNTQAAMFHTVIHAQGVDWLTMNESTPCAGGQFVSDASPYSARSWTTVDTESSFEACHFQPKAPNIRTQRPASVPPLAIPGAGPGGALKWPSDSAQSTGKSTALSSSGTVISNSTLAQASRLASALRPDQTFNKPLKTCAGPLKVSKPCGPALRKMSEVSPAGLGEGLDSLDEAADSPEHEDVSPNFDPEALERIKNYLASCPDITEEDLGAELPRTSANTNSHSCGDSKAKEAALSASIRERTAYVGGA